MVGETLVVWKFRERPSCWPIVSRSATLPTVAMTAAVPTFSWTYKARQRQQPSPPLMSSAHMRSSAWIPHICAHYYTILVWSIASHLLNCQKNMEIFHWERETKGQHWFSLMEHVWEAKLSPQKVPLHWVWGGLAGKHNVTHHGNEPLSEIVFPGPLILIETWRHLPLQEKT